MGDRMALGYVVGSLEADTAREAARKAEKAAEAAGRQVESLQREVLSLKEQNRQSVCKVAGHLAVRRALRDALAEVAPDHPLANPFDDNPRRDAIFDEASQREWERYDAK